jgi:ABC-type branched-subunit amino acid transport system permease subunit
VNQVIQIVINGLLQDGIVFAIVALGFCLVYRVTGVINLAQGAFCVLGALLMYTLQTTLHWPIVFALPLAAAGTAGVGFVLGAVSFVPALSRLPNSSVLMLTTGLLTLIEGGILVGWGAEPYQLPPYSGFAPIMIFGLGVASQGFWILGTVAAIVVALWYLLARTAVGMALRACAENRLAAQLMGIDVRRMTLLSFTLAALIGGIGGIVVAPITSLQFDAGHFFTNFGFIAVAIGGIGSFIGSVAGGIAIGITKQLAAGYVSSLFANALVLGLLLLTLIWRPNGLFTSGPARRQDVRDEQRVYRAIVRLQGRGGLAFGLALLAFVLVLPQVLPPGGILSSLVITGILYISVLGLDVLMGHAGQVSLGQAGFMAIGGYTAAILATRYHVAPLIGIGAGIALSLVVALILSLVTMRLRGHYLALATLAFGLLVDSLSVGMMDTTGGPSGLIGIPSFSIGPLVLSTPQAMYYFVAGLVTVLVLALMGAMNSGFGRALKAVRTDQTAAAALGIDVPRYKLMAAAISSVLASLSGSLYAFYFHFLSPDMVATPRSFEMIAMLVVGGEGTLIGPLFGVALLTLLPTLFQSFKGYLTFAEGAILVASFLWLPEGLFGTAAMMVTRLARRFTAQKAVP